VPRTSPEQHESGDSREEAGLTVEVRAEVDPTTMTTDPSDGVGDGIDGSSGGGD
jgi:hypothetical protein